MSRVSEGLYDAAIANLAALLTVAYTTDNPGITPNGTLTIADGDAATVTRAEYNELAEELESALSAVRAKVNDILTALRATGVIRTTGGVVVATTPTTVAPAAYTVSFTTDNPGISANNTLTIADGDAATVTRAEYNEAVVDLAAKFNALRTALITAGVLASA